MSFGGTVAIRVMKGNDFAATPFPGTAAGLQAAIDFLRTTGGKISIGPGTLACGTTALAITGMSGALSIVMEGCGERATILTYTGSSDFFTVGADDGVHSGSPGGYNGTGPQLKMRDIRLSGPGIGTTARGLVDWENGSAVFERILFDGWSVGYKGVGSDVTSFKDCLFSSCAKGAFLASRCDQNTFYSCYFTECTIGANIEYSWGSRFFGCQFVFNTTADIVYDAPASPTDSGDIRTDTVSTVDGCWFESAASPQLARHIWFGRNGTAVRLLAGLSVTGGYILASNTLNFVEVEGGSVVRVTDVFQGGGAGLSGSLVSITGVGGLVPEVTVRDAHKSGGTILGGSPGTYVAVTQGSSTFVGTSGNIVTSADGTQITFSAAGVANVIKAANATSNLRLGGANATQIECNSGGVIVTGALSCSSDFTAHDGSTPIKKVLSATASLDFDLTALTVQDLTMTLTGAALGDATYIGVPNGSVTASVQYTGWVSAANTVTIRARTVAVGENPASGTFRATVIQH